MKQLKRLDPLHVILVLAAAGASVAARAEMPETAADYAILTRAGATTAESSVKVDNDLNVGLDEANELFSGDDLPALQRFQDQAEAARENDAGALTETVSGGEVVIDINKKSQRMNVKVNGQAKYSDWKISTGMRGSETRSGTFTPFEMSRNYVSKRFSREYRQTIVLPYGIKFDGGNLIHAASSGGVHYLGIKHSHGCVRLQPANAKKLFDLVKQVGMKNVRVVVH